MVQEMDWISVKDRLPERLQRVIVYAAGIILSDCCYLRDGFYDNNTGLKIDPDLITHWMPLPEPPK